MTDDELMDEFIKVLPQADVWSLQGPSSKSPHIQPQIENGLAVLVCDISWNSLEPVSTWLKVANLPEDADQARIRKEIRRVLKLRTYFKVCEICKDKNPVGWMNGYVCHSCEEKAGVVF